MFIYVPHNFLNLTIFYIEQQDQNAKRKQFLLLSDLLTWSSTRICLKMRKP